MSPPNPASPLPVQLLLERMPSELTDPRGKQIVEGVFDSLNQVLVRDIQGQIRVDEGVFRRALTDNLGLSAGDATRVVGMWPDVFTSTPDLPKISLAEFQAQEPHLSIVTAEDLDRAGFLVGGDAATMRAAFLKAYGRPIPDAALNASPKELFNRVRAAMQSIQLQSAAGTSQFVSCLGHYLIGILLTLATFAVAAWGIIAGWLGTIVIVVGGSVIVVTTTFLWWALAVAFGLWVATVIIACVTGLWH